MPIAYIAGMPGSCDKCDDTTIPKICKSIECSSLINKRNFGFLDLKLKLSIVKMIAEMKTVVFALEAVANFGRCLVLIRIRELTDVRS